MQVRGAPGKTRAIADRRAPSALRCNMIRDNNKLIRRRGRVPEWARPTHEEMAKRLQLRVIEGPQSAARGAGAIPGNARSRRGRVEVEPGRRHRRPTTGSRRRKR